MPIVMSVLFAVRLKRIFEFVLCIVTHDDLKGTLLTLISSISISREFKAHIKK